MPEQPGQHNNQHHEGSCPHQPNHPLSHPLFVVVVAIVVVVTSGAGGRVVDCGVVVDVTSGGVNGVGVGGGVVGGCNVCWGGAW